MIKLNGDVPIIITVRALKLLHIPRHFKYLRKAIINKQIFTWIYIFQRFSHQNISFLRVREGFKYIICTNFTLEILLSAYSSNLSVGAPHKKGRSLMYPIRLNVQGTIQHYAKSQQNPSLLLRYAQNSVESPSHSLPLPFTRYSITMLPPMRVLIEQRLTVVPNYISFTEFHHFKTTHSSHCLVD